MRIRNEDVLPARRAIRAALDYQHPVSRCGVRNATMLKLIQLDRVLREHGATVDEAVIELLNRHGKRRDKGDPKSAYIPKDDANARQAFILAQQDLMRREIEVEDRYKIALSELQVRDENGEYEDMEDGRIGGFGLLLTDVGDGAESEEPSTPPKRRRGRG